MKTKMKNIGKGIGKQFKKGSKLSTGIAKASSFVLGDVHFLLKSSADMTVKAEANIANKLTGVSKEAVIEDRHNRTEKTQEMIRATTAGFAERISSLFHSVDDDVLETITNAQINS